MRRSLDEIDCIIFLIIIWSWYCSYLHLSCKVFVHVALTYYIKYCFLFSQTSELELENFFSTFGEVTDVRIVCDRKTGFNKG